MIVLLLACGGEAAVPPPPLAPVEAAPVIIDIRSVADFTAAEVAVSDLGLNGHEGLVEVHFAPGTYAGRTLQLDTQDGPTRVLLRGAEGVWLEGAGIEVRATSVEARGLGFRGTHGGFAMRVEVKDTATLGELAFSDFTPAVDGRAGRVRRGLVELVAAGPSATASLPSWRIEGSGLAESALLQVGVQPGSRWTDVALSDWAAKAVTASAVVLTSGVDKVRIDGSRIEVPAGGVLLHAAVKTTTLEVRDCELVLADGAAIGTVEPTVFERVTTP